MLQNHCMIRAKVFHTKASTSLLESTLGPMSKVCPTPSVL